MKGNHHLSGSKSRNSFLLHQGIFKKIVIYDIDLNILNNGIPLKCVNISKKLEAKVEKTVIKWNLSPLLRKQSPGLVCSIYKRNPIKNLSIISQAILWL